MTEHLVHGDTEFAGAAQADFPTIPGYRIVAERGRGGMGVVYQAEQVNSGRMVALKLIRDNALAGPQERGRFRIESEAAARMQHPNIVQIYEVGEHQGRAYFAMELIEGTSLDQFLAGQPQPAQQAGELVRTLALAVQHAHEQQVVHRDLKPANILLKDEGGRMKDEGNASATLGSSFILHPSSLRIGDFGLAKRLDSDSTAWTQEGAVIGTASYMAPEQAAGRSNAIGPAVDIYALGAILYEMLTGRPPFLADSWSQTLHQVIYDDPEPPARSRPQVSADLETICLKCLEKDPARRYASAAELAEDLRRFLAGQPVAAVPVSRRDRLARLAERDGYTIESEIGRGPRSLVYHAFFQALKQPVALKVFAAGVCTRPEWEEQLRRSENLRTMLTHPQIVPVHWTGWWNDGPCLAVEYLPHGSLAAKLAAQPFSVSQAIQTVEQIAEVVSYIHRQGLVHGNLKASNVLLAADGIPRLVDFRPFGGLFQGKLGAQFPEPDGIGYLAPELVENPGAEVRFSTDIYGLGLILYELLAGRPPFAGATAEEALEQVRSREPEPPSRFNSGVTPDLDSLCLRCLRKNPWRRYSRAYDVFAELRHFREGPGKK